jgi:Coenzyme PQQ synthesis protein D (PqqD)
MLPNSRRQNLLIQEVGAELVVYDQERHRVHRLNPTTAEVWRLCDGRTTIAEIVTLLKSNGKIPASESMVWLALGRLQKAHLLQDRLRMPARIGISRREAMAIGLGSAAAFLLPGCQSVTAPTPQEAQAGSAPLPVTAAKKPIPGVGCTAACGPAKIKNNKVTCTRTKDCEAGTGAAGGCRCIAFVTFNAAGAITGAQEQGCCLRLRRLRHKLPVATPIIPNRPFQRDHDFSARVSSFEIAKSIRDLTQPVTPVDHWYELTALQQPLDGCQVGLARPGQKHDVLPTCNA